MLEEFLIKGVQLNETVKKNQNSHIQRKDPFCNLKGIYNFAGCNLITVYSICNPFPNKAAIKSQQDSNHIHTKHQLNPTIKHMGPY